MAEARQPVVKRIDHIGVAVRDIEASLPYFVDVLGLTVAVDVYLADGSARLAYLEAGDTTLQLVQPLKPGPVADHLAVHGEGLHHVCFAVDEIVSTLQALPGGERSDRVYVGGKGCLVSFIAARPSNINIELTENRPATHHGGGEP